MNKYRLLKMNSLGGCYYAKEIATGRFISLKTADREAAEKLLQAMNEAARNTAMTHQAALTRTFKNVLDAFIAATPGRTPWRAS